MNYLIPYKNESKIFAHLLKNNQRSLAGRRVYPYFNTLVQKGLLIRGEGPASVLHWPHMVPDDVWTELVRRRDKFV